MQPGGREELLEVERLAVVDDVEDRVRPPRLHAVAERGQVGRGVEEGAVLLADDHRHVVAVEEDADGPSLCWAIPRRNNSSTSGPQRSW